MNIGAPNGAAASSRADAGDASPAESRARNRCPPTDPAAAISAVMVETARQVLVASDTASRASLAGLPGPAGSFISGAAQDAHSNAPMRNGIALIARPEPVDQPPRFALRRSAVALAKAEGRADDSWFDGPVLSELLI